MKWEIEMEGLVAFAELAAESAMSELSAFGCIGFEEGHGATGHPDRGERPEVYESAWQAFEDMAEYVPFELY